MEVLGGGVAAARSSTFPLGDHGGSPCFQIHFCRWTRPGLRLQHRIWSRFSRSKLPRLAAFATGATGAADIVNPEEEADDPGVAVVSTEFVLEKRCEYGERFVVAGEHKLLGAWDPDSGLPMTWSEGHVWKCKADLPVGNVYEYKFVLTSKEAEPDWQPGPNRSFSTTDVEPPLIVSESWDQAGVDESVKPEVEGGGLDESPIAEEVHVDGVEDELGEAAEPEVIAEAKAGLPEEDDVNETVPELTEISAENEPTVVEEDVATDTSSPVSASGKIPEDEETEEKTAPVSLKHALEHEDTVLTSPPADTDVAAAAAKAGSRKEPEEMDNGQPPAVKDSDEVPFLELSLASTVLQGDEEKTEDA